MAESKSRGGYLRDWFNTWHVHDTVSLSRRPGHITTVRIALLTPQGFDLNAKYYGDELSWDEIKVARLSWGTGGTVRWVSPVTGWEYKYDVSMGLWNVIDAAGNTVETVKTHDISDFGISWDVISSHNFFIYFSIGYLSTETFLVAWKLPRGYIIDPDTGEIVPSNPDGDKDTAGIPESAHGSFADPFVSDGLCWYRRGFFAEMSRPFETFTTELEEYFLPPPEPMHIIRPCGPAREQLGDYSTVGLGFEKIASFAEALKRRDAYMMAISEILLSLVFATISNRGKKPVYEPWMLWEMWKWFGDIKGPLPGDTIFDLIPNWG